MVGNLTEFEACLLLYTINLLSEYLKVSVSESSSISFAQILVIVFPHRKEEIRASVGSKTKVPYLSYSAGFMFFSDIASVFASCCFAC